MAIPATPLDPSQTGFTASLKSVLARLTAADVLMSTTTTTVYEINAIVRDMIAVCGPVITFKALAQHVNDVFSGDVPTNSAYIPYYNGGYDSDIIKSSSSTTTLSQGQEIALCMFIRAGLDLDIMTEVVPYSYLVSYLHSRITYNSTSTYITRTTYTSGVGVDSSTNASEGAVSTDLLNSRRYQYDLSTLVSSSGVSSVTITDAMATPSELLYVASVDTNATTTVTNYISYRLWLITKVTSSSHKIRESLAISTATYSTITGTHATASSTLTTTFYSPYKFTATSTTSLFTTSNVITYLLDISGSQSFTHSSKTTYLNGYVSATSPGTLNGDRILLQSTLNNLTPKSLLDNGATLANLYAIGIKLDDVIDLNSSSSSVITVATAASAGWSAANIAASKFSFYDKTFAGTDFKYFSLTGKPLDDKPLLDKLIALYTTVANSTGIKTFSAAVEARYTTITERNFPPSGPRAVAIAVTAWLFNNLETYTSTRTATKIMLENGAVTSIPFFQSFFSAASTEPHNITLYDVFDLKTIANASSDGLSIASGFLPREIKTYFNINAGVARDNGWSPALILSTFSPKEIFSNSNKRMTNTSSSPYGVSVAEALLGYNSITAAQFFKLKSTFMAGTADTAAGVESATKLTGNRDINTFLTRFNYDGISYATLSLLLPQSQIISDIQTVMKDSDSYNKDPQTSAFSGANRTVFPKLVLTSANISAFIDALQLPFAVAKSLVGSNWWNSATSLNEKLTEVHLANTTIYSKADRRSVFDNLSDAADKYAAAGLPVSAFVSLGFPVSAWQAYAAIAAVDRSNNVSLRDLLSTTETVEDYDNDFYIVANATKRAIYNTLEARKALVLLFIPNLPDAEARALASGPPSDLPHVVL
jgi:hypothetical protein